MDSDPPTATWRLLLSPAATGARNMAVDEAILQSIAAGDAPPTLRCFAWAPPCLSLGYGQSSSAVDVARLRAQGYDLVRRPTGGRAILHTDELTYSAIVPLSDPRVAGGVIASYRRLSAGLLAGLQQLGLQARSDHAAAAGEAAGPVCFEIPSNYEITVDGKKLLGSAQLRKRGVLLQHGTLPLSGDIARICDGLTFPDEAARDRARQRVRDRATTVAAVTGSAVSWTAAAHALTAGFAAALNLTLEPGDLSAAELRRAAALEADKYGRESWTVGRRM